MGPHSPSEGDTGASPQTRGLTHGAQEHRCDNSASICGKLNPVTHKLCIMANLGLFQDCKVVSYRKI